MVHGNGAAGAGGEVVGGAGHVLGVLGSAVVGR